MTTRATLAAAFLCGLALVPLTAAAPQLTADQQLVAGLRAARAASRSALRNLAQPSLARTTRASADLLRALAALDTATRIAPRAVGAIETPSVRTGLRGAATLSRDARSDIEHGRYAAARAKISKALILKTSALADFGVPLAKEFPTFAVNRSLRYVHGFEDYSALTATVGAEVSEIIIGGANRITANAGEPRGRSATTATQLPITKMSEFLVSEPNGEAAGGWCSLSDGLITCMLIPAMRTDERFTIAFGPKPARGTKVLVKFRTASGGRAYYVLTLR